MFLHRLCFTSPRRRFSFLCCTERARGAHEPAQGHTAKGAGPELETRLFVSKSLHCAQLPGPNREEQNPCGQPEGQAVWQVLDVEMVGRLCLWNLGAYHLTVPVDHHCGPSQHTRVPALHTICTWHCVYFRACLGPMQDAPPYAPSSRSCSHVCVPSPRTFVTALCTI